MASAPPPTPRRARGEAGQGTTHVVGAGLAGLSCALHLARAGRRVAVWEAAGHAGGRCRSFHDAGLDRLIDNGSHMLLGANEETRRYLARLGAAGRMTEIAPAVFPFRDLRTGRTWRVAPGAGRVPLWLLAPGRVAPGLRWRDLPRLAKLAGAGPSATVRDCVGRDHPLYETFLRPLSLAVLNTDPAAGSARLLWRVIRETFLAGERACRPCFFAGGLSPALIDPAVRALAAQGAPVRMRSRLRALDRSGRRAEALRFAGGAVALSADDDAVLAVPADACRALLPGEVAAPGRFNPILNVHFRLDLPAVLPWGLPFLGLIGGEAQWLFARGDLVSVTVSAAGAAAGRPAAEAAQGLWAEIAPVLGGGRKRVPPFRVVKERRATIVQGPAEAARRQGTRTRLANVFVAGDWTDTGMPATIEGAVRSGLRAAEAALARPRACAGTRAGVHSAGRNKEETP